MRGMILLWERCRMLRILWRTCGSRWWRTWWGFPSTSEKSLESAASQISFIVGWDDGNKLCFIIFVSSVWRRCLLLSSSIPHQAELAYAILDTTVALVTSQRVAGYNAWEAGIAKSPRFPCLIGLSESTGLNNIHHNCLCHCHWKCSTLHIWASKLFILSRSTNTQP